MKTEMIMPQMGESITEATVIRWLKNAGERVEKDETLLEISTDKVDSEVPASASGVLTEILVKAGETVPVRSVIAVIETSEATAGVQPEVEQDKRPEPQPASPSLSPLAKNVAAQQKLSESQVSEIKGTGAKGRVTKSDILQYVEGRSETQTMVPPPQTIEFGSDSIKVEPMDHMRRRIAEHMVRSKATSPHVYTVAELDLTRASQWKKKIQEEFQAREGIKLSFTPFFIEAAAKALAKFPYVNASVEQDNIILKRQINIGCAVAVGSADEGNTGLVVPVIRNADQLSFVGIARALNDFAARARNRKLTPEDTQGGTFTVTNPGIFGSILSYPIINQPQVAILSLGAIKKRPIVVEDMIAIREVVYVTLSYDHRIIDGAVAGQFLQTVVKHLENWDFNRPL